MADIILAQCGGTTWLVEGDRHMQDLLGNSLSPAVTIGFLECASTEHVMAMWAGRAGAETNPDAVPWMINPAIVRRIQRVLAGPSIAFPPWSAMLDADAEDVLRAAAGKLADGRLALRQFCPAEAAPGLADLLRLRATLVTAALVRAGADPAALLHETAEAANPGDENRLDLVTLAIPEG